MIKVLIVLIGALLISGCNTMPHHNIYLGQTIGNTGVSIQTIGGQTSIGISGTTR